MVFEIPTDWLCLSDPCCRPLMLLDWGKHWVGIVVASGFVDAALFPGCICDLLVESAVVLVFVVVVVVVVVVFVVVGVVAVVESDVLDVVDNLAGVVVVVVVVVDSFVVVVVVVFVDGFDSMVASRYFS